MTKKMKGVAFDSSHQASYLDGKARFKHQTLVQDYVELQEETEAARNKLEAMKQRKLTLLAEVRFLRQRYKFLMKNKSSQPPQEREPVKPQYVETQLKNSKDRNHSKKQATLRNLPPIYNLNQKGRVYMEKKNVHPALTPVFDLNHNDTLHVVKQQTLHKAAIQATNLNHRVRMKGVKEVGLRKPMIVTDLNQKQLINSSAALRNPSPVFDLNQKEATFSSKEAIGQSRAPVFDLNQISREEEEEEEFQENEPLSYEEPRKGLIRGGVDEHNDLKLSVCRNVGDGSTSRPGKRKISWQDPVALRV